MSVKGYKAMNKNLICRDFKFQVGKTYTHKEDFQLCNSGFHFCLNIFDVYNYYPKSADTVVCEIEALGEIKTQGDKSVTNKIKIIKQLNTLELLKLWINKMSSGYGNSGDRNSGDRNSGNGNSGDRNSGDRNSGNGNSGDRNNGDRNSGNGNSGDRNSGDRNSGYGNSGYGNSGDRNSGDWNSGNGNSGYFNTTVPVYFFNKPSMVQYTTELEQKIRSINVKPVLTYVYSDNMTEEEKINNPSYNITGGFLRKTDKMYWGSLTEQDKEFIKSLPNFDANIFKQISGVDLSVPKTVKVMVNGEEYEIDIEKAKELGLIK